MSKKHIIFYTLIRPLAVLYVRMKFNYTYTVAKDLPETYIVLSNHTTDYDPIFVAASFPRQMYFVGSEHISRWKWIYKLLKFLVDPIMRPKGALASTTVIEMLRKVRGGANVCLFAEGVRSWDGAPAPILPSTGKMIKSARCGLVTYRISGGYFASPMWSSSSTVRRGPVHGEVVNVYTAEQLAAMTAVEVQEIIVRDLGEDAYERQMAAPKKYTCKNPAESMENLLFICPECGGIDTFRSGGSTVSCSACGHSFRYTEYGMLEGGAFPTIRELSRWQNEQVQLAAANNATYTAPSASLSRVANQQETFLGEGPLSLSADRLVCGDTEFPLSSISDLAMHGKRAIVFTVHKDYYELIPSSEANALKFMLLYQAYQKKAAEMQAV